MDETDSQSYWSGNTPWAFRDLRKKPTYQERRKKRYSLQNYMSETIGFDRYSGKRVLEVGSGSGLDAAEFARHGADVMAVDFTQTACDETASTFEQARVIGKVKKASVYDLPFYDGRFDVVYCFGVLHHLEMPVSAILEMRRVLKTGGEFIGMVYNKDSILYKLSIQALGLEFERIPGVPHTRAYTAKEVISLFSDWFSDIEIAVRYPVVDLPDRRKVKLDFPEDWPYGWHLIVRAKRVF